ncbi:site-specific DNA-methyltransferase [Akkermansia muciniphila]|uniref:site-specific DNA-methyltransferase n=1 Tax=Akkermansia muciniphila TaxID=239935 RepID=UPI003CCC8B11
MEKMRMESVDMTAQNIDKIAALFPICITETMGENGKPKRAVNFELLKQMLSDEVIGGDEAYEFTWVGKKAAIVEANKPIRKTLRPCKEESVNWDSTENLYIEGDNLEVLKLLQESYLGKVKMIYIDPPYNTGKDSFIYPDNYMMDNESYEEGVGLFDEDDLRLFAENNDSNPRFHSDWCSMIYSRLTLARNLLSDNGVLLISIDDNEIENLRKISNEIFGEQNLVNCFIWNCSTAGGIRPKFASKTHEYILCYAKRKENLSMFFAPLSADAKKMYTQQDAKGLYRDKDFIFKNKSTNINQKYLIECPDGEMVRPKDGYIYRFIRERFDEALCDGMVTFKKTSTGPLVTESGEQAHWNIYIKKYLGDAMGAPSTLIPKEMMSIYNVGTQCVQTLFDDTRVFENVKPVDVITYLINMVADKDSIILDFFSGSATTAHAVMQLNAEAGGKRRFIMVQLPEPCDEKSEAYKTGYSTICEIGKERIRRAAKKIAEEYPSASFDGGFRVFKLDDSNMKDVYYSPAEYDQGMLSGLESNIKEDRTDLDLLFGCLLEWGLPLSERMTVFQIDGVDVHVYGMDAEEYRGCKDGMFFYEDNIQMIDNQLYTPPPPHTHTRVPLLACFADRVPESVIRGIAGMKPLCAVFRDSCFQDSPAKINVTEVFKLLAPDTRVKVI